MHDLIELLPVLGLLRSFSTEKKGTPQKGVHGGYNDTFLQTKLLELVCRKRKRVLVQI